MNFDPRQARITLLLFLVFFGAGQAWLYLNRPLYPPAERYRKDWPPAGCLVDASVLESRALEVFPPGTTVGEALRRLELEPDVTGSGFCLPRAGVLHRSMDGWRVRPMSQAERFVWRIPMELPDCLPEDLQRIRGVGPILARKIRHFAQERGHIESVEALDAVPGVGPKKLEALKRELE